MGIGPENPRWMELLRWGMHAQNARFFDVEWQPPQRHLRGKILLPVLDRPLDEVLAAGDIRLEYDGTEITARQGAQIWPLTPPSYGPILAEAGLTDLARGFGALDRPGSDSLRLLAALAERPGALNHTLGRWNADRLRPLLERQCWYLDDWRKAATEINYRRFFAINDLAAIRVEDAAVFDASHQLILHLVGAGLVDGLRIDHIDGLADPKQYLDRLARAMTARGRTPYILVEKILAPGEAMPASWPIMGSTGYDRIGPIDRLFVDPPGMAAMVRRYRSETGRPESAAPMVRAAKTRFLDAEYASELNRLARVAQKFADETEAFSAISTDAIAAGFSAVIARLPVYRTYLGRDAITATDRSRLAAAIDRAAIADPVLARFLRGLLTQSPISQSALDTITFFQQLSGPAMAKGLEDTVFFQYVPLLALNEVGGEATVEAGDIASFHAFNAALGRVGSAALIAGSTHDTKRGEDARARLLCLTSAPDLWEGALARWRDWNARFGRTLPSGSAPSANDEYYLYQSLIGAWPPGLRPDDQAGLAAFRVRIGPAMLKAVREAKERTSWNEPDTDYEAALDHFINALFDRDRSGAFLADLAGFCERLGFWGALTSLSATLLRLSTPGVPDLYQGSEGWNLSLVDPDNRRPVDFAALAAQSGDAAARISAWHDGAVKSFLIRRVLALRATAPRLFAHGSYRPLAPTGEQADYLVAYLREGSRGDRLAALVPRFWPRLRPDMTSPAIWGNTAITLPAGIYRNILTGIPHISDGALPLRVGELLAGFPVGLLTAT
jgi:(1->4)-alpha-D-glucan 1-alpha-D-glucosylmutase